MSARSELLQGTLDLLVLKALSLAPNHGLGIARRVEQLTGGTFQVKPGSLFPALHRLEEKGWLVSEWGDSENNRRAKFYQLTRSGRSQFKVEVELGSDFAGDQPVARGHLVNRLLAGLRNLFRRDRVERDLAAEVDSYLELLVAEKIRAGMSPERARRAARLELGTKDQVKESVRDVRSGAGFEHLVRDLRHGLRGLRRNPAFSIFAILTFAVSIGGITTIATLVDAVLIRPLPYPESDRLVVVLEASRNDQGAGFSAAYPNFRDWESRNRVFQRLALYEYLDFNLSGDGEPEQVSGLRATAGLFPVLEKTPFLGRGLVAEDERGQNGRVVVLSYRLWQRRFGGDSAIVGRTIRINKEPATVVGVMPRGFSFPSVHQQLWMPLVPNAEDESRGSHSFWSIARLGDGVSLVEAKTAMRTIGDQLAREYPGDNAEETVNVTPLRDLWLLDVARTLRILLVAVALVGIIATANVASLLVARGIARRRELAARLALGGTRRRIGGQLVTEAVLLAGLGALIGLGIARFGLPTLLRVSPAFGNLPFRDLSDLGANWRVFGMAVVVALVTGVVAGLIPALVVVPSSPGLVLKEGEARGSTARTGKRLRNALVAIEVALAMVVLAGAALLVVSIRRQLAVNPGLDPSNVVAMKLALPQADFYGVPSRPDFCAQLEERVGGIPGVVAVSAISHVPLSGSNAGRSFVVEGQPDSGPQNVPSGNYGVACPGYFRTMGIPLIEGRDFAATDRVDAPGVVIVNQEIVRRYFGVGSPIGKRIRFGRFDSRGDWVTVIGVSGNVHHDGLSSAEPRYLYRPYSQTVWPSLAVMVKAAANPASVVGPVRAAVSAIAPEEPIGAPLTMVEFIERSLGPIRFPMVMFTLFGAVAVLLAAIGIFGVASQSVVQRTRELGIRRAIGASEPHLYRLVIGQSLGPVAIGIVGGLIAGLLSAGVLRSLLYGIEPTSPGTFAAVAGGLALIAVVAAFVPARRAARIDPIVALRED